MSPLEMIRPRRAITGMSAILLPFTADGRVDWPAFEQHVVRTSESCLTPAVNMDTGYVNLLDDATKLEVLKRTQSVLNGEPFVAGAFVPSRAGDPFRESDYARAFEQITSHGGTPVIFQSFGLTSLPEPELIAAYEKLGNYCESFIAFELGTMFAPFGRIYSLDAYRGLLGIEKCIGAKHSSLSRELEWQRLKLRDDVRPGFQVLTGNDLAIDMVMYGSDYLLGLSTFAPDLFGLRDQYWSEGDPRFFELNDVLQYLGFLAFREPVPAYKHSAAMFLKLRGHIDCDDTHPASPKRPDSDRAILQLIARRLEEFA